MDIINRELLDDDNVDHADGELVHKAFRYYISEVPQNRILHVFDTDFLVLPGGVDAIIIEDQSELRAFLEKVMLGLSQIIHLALGDQLVDEMQLLANVNSMGPQKPYDLRFASFAVDDLVILISFCNVRPKDVRAI